MADTVAVSGRMEVLDWRGDKASLLQLGLVGAATLLPAVCHLAGAPVRVFLPMHWPVLLAGLVYGWRGGLAVGMAAPLASFALSGMPSAALLPAMGAEIAAYGLCAGLAREAFRFNAYASAAMAVLAGRAVYAASALASGAQFGLVSAALVPGAVAAVLQIALLPSLAEKWVGKERG